MKWKSKNYADFGRFLITDDYLAYVTKKHMRIIDRFDFKKVVAMTEFMFTDLANNGGKDPYDDKTKFKFTKEGWIERIET